MAKKARKASKSPPKRCSDAFIMRCIGPSPKGEYQCSVFPMSVSTGDIRWEACAGAVINIKKGTVRFYE